MPMPLYIYSNTLPPDLLYLECTIHNARQRHGFIIGNNIGGGNCNRRGRQKNAELMVGLSG